MLIDTFPEWWQARPETNALLGILDEHHGAGTVSSRMDMSAGVADGRSPPKRDAIRKMSVR